MPLSSPYGALGYEPGVDVSSFPSGEMRGIKNGEAFSIDPSQAGKYSNTFSQNGQQYTRLGMPVDDWFSVNQFAKNSVKNLDKNNIGYIEDPTYGYAALSSAIDPVIKESSEIQSRANNSGFWNGMGPFALAALAFGGLPIATQMGAFGGAGLAGAEGSSAIGSAGADTLGGAVGASDLTGTQLAQLANPSYLQSFPGMSTPGVLGTPGLGTTIVDPALAGIASGGAAPYAGDAAYEQAGLEDYASRTPETALNGQSYIDSLIQSLSDPKQLMSRLASSAVQSVGNSISKNPIGTALSIGSGIYGLTEARRQRELAERVAASSDPFGPYRGQYAQQLSELSADPTKLTNLPGYKAGLQAVERSMASRGYLGSGNMATALFKYGGDAFQQEAARLAGLAGAGANPAAAGQLLLSGNSGANDLASRSLASIGYGLSGNSSNEAMLRLIALAAGRG